MRSFGVVVATPFLDDHLCLLEATEDFSVEQFVPKLAIE